jgi:uncharacterized protein
MAEHRGAVAPPGLHVLAKPAGPLCNLACAYCFYLEKKNLYPRPHPFRMSEAVLERFIRQYIAASALPEVSFAWQGGEPTLMGVDFFRRVVELQRRHRAPGTRITNSLQTNGLLLDDEWCAFLRREGFLVGLSIDGPRHLHDVHRVDGDGRPTFDRALRSLHLLQRHGVEFNTLTVVHRENGEHPLEVYRFLRDCGSHFLQFIPLVERVTAEGALSGPPVPDRAPGAASVSPWSVGPEQYGRFLCSVFDEWVGNDVGRIHVQLFEVQLGVRMGMTASLCLFSPTCGRAVVLEHDGDVFACDHYVYPEYRRGNILSRSLAECAGSPEQREFGRMKRNALPRACRACDVRFACHGECPKRRFVTSAEGETGLNYLCPAYKRFFHHIEAPMGEMADLLGRGLPAALIMDPRARREAAAGQRVAARAARNDPCPCGSGRKFKKCCGAAGAAAAGSGGSARPGSGPRR